MATLDPRDIDKKLGTIPSPLPALGRANTLSVCMIVKNEEKNIEAAIRSFLPFADEIVVNDTGSTDRTLEILSRLPVKVIQNPWEGDFSKARNQSFDVATCAWLIWMDADDLVPPESIEDIKQLKTAPLDRSFGFQVINTQGGMPLGARFYQTRMFPRHPKLRFERKVHEQIIYAIANLGLHAMFIETQIWHTGYEDESLKKAKSLRNLDLMLGDPDYDVDPILAMQVGDAYAIAEEWEKSIEAYLHSYQMPHCRETQVDAWAEIPNSIGRCYQSLKQFDEAKKWFQIGAQSGSGKIEPIYYLGELAMIQNFSDEAIQYFRQALELPRTHSSVANQYDVLKIHGYHNICRLLNQKSNYEEACRYAQKFVEEYPQVIEAKLHQGKALLSLRRPTEAIPHLRQVIESNPENKEAWEAFFSALDLQKTPESEITALRQQAAAYFPHLGPQNKNQGLLSIAMIVKNEEDDLTGCLESIRGLWDELVIVDTGSTDKTIQIAKQYGAKVLNFPWIGDFSAARNHSLDGCTNKWILWLDADDRIPVSEKDRIRPLIQNSEPKAFALLIQNTTDSGTTGDSFSQIRLFPNHPKIRFVGKVHEQLLDQIRSANIDLDFKTIRIFHTGYVNPEVVAQKQKRNLEIMLEEGGEHPDLLSSVKQYSIAGAYQDLKQYALAIEWFRKAESRARKLGEDPHVREYAPIKVVQCLAEQGHYEEAFDSLQALLIIFPFNPEARLLHAQILQARNLHDQAAMAFTRLFAFEQIPTLMPVDFNSLKYKAVRFLADWLNQNQQIECAIALLRLGKSLSQGSALSVSEVVEILWNGSFYDLSMELLEFENRMRPNPQNDFERARALVMLNQVQNSLSLLTESIKRYPHFKLTRELFDLINQDLNRV